MTSVTFFAYFSSYLVEQNIKEVLSMKASKKMIFLVIGTMLFSFGAIVASRAADFMFCQKICKDILNTKEGLKKY